MLNSQSNSTGVRFVNEQIKEILHKARGERRYALFEDEAKRILRLLGLHTPNEKVIESVEEAISASDKIGYPVVLKIVSQDILHKSDVEAVVTGLRDSDDVRKAYASILANVNQKAPNARVRGFSVQSEAKGIEVVVGAKRDAIFGPFVMFGIGGVLVELLKDFTIRFCPISKLDALDMVRSIKSYPVLDGYRGTTKADLNAIAEAICSLSHLIENFEEIAEIDVNPLMVVKEGKGCVAVDARIILSSDDDVMRVSQRNAALAGDAVRQLLEARSIAIIGGSRNPLKIGGRVVSRIIDHKYDGVVDIVNPKAEAFQGLTTYKSIGDIPYPVDCAIICIPPQVLINAIEECSAKKVKTAIVITAGFGESGEEGIARQKKLVETLARGGVRIIGPNTAGALRPISKLYAYFTTFAENTDVGQGNVGFVTQSGALGSALVSKAVDAGVKISAWVSTGNEADLDWTDVVDFLIDDAHTKVIVAYVEGIRSGTKLRSVAERALRSKKPIILFKSGVSEAGKLAAKSHTGSMAVEEALVDAFTKQFGIIRVEELSDTFEIARAFSLQPLPKGENVGVVSASGGANIIIADELTKRGANLPELPEATQSKLARDIPFSTTRNPVDAGGQIINDPTLFKKAIVTVFEDPNIDCVIIGVPGGSESSADSRARSVADCACYGKPMIVVWLYSPTRVLSLIQYLNEKNIPVYFEVEKAAKVMAALVQYRKFLNSRGIS